MVRDTIAEARAGSLCRLVAVGTALFGAGHGAPVLAQSAAACAALKSSAPPNTALEITSTQHVAAGPPPAGPQGRAPFAAALPAHCRVEGILERRTGVAGVEYGIRFALALPDDWNDRFLFQGGGGLNGSVGQPFGAQAAGDTPALARGFAVVSNDTGHQGSGFDGSFMADQEAMLNFLWLANGRSPSSRNRSSTRITRNPRSIRTSSAARRAAARR